jgi:hypothetical protein
MVAGRWPILGRMTRWWAILSLLAAGEGAVAQAPNPYTPRTYSAGPATVAGPRDLSWTPVDRKDLDLKLITREGTRALEFPGMKWQHAHTDHFVVHYEREIFARKVARMAEFYYQYIRDDVAGPKDRMDGRSHIFVFRSPEKWKAFLAGGDASSWAFSYVSGPMMFLQEADDTESSAGVLAHELSHLILNRFFSGRPPLWLNEGLAEWYGEFAYAAFKGVKKSQRAQFKSIKDPVPLETLLVAPSYPEDPAQVSRFYATSKFAVAHLRLSWPPAVFVAYLRDIMDGKDSVESLGQHFGVRSPAEFQVGFNKFLR